MNLGTTEEGHPLLSNARIVAYGAGGYALWDGQNVGGCPAQYRAKYVDHKVQAWESNDQLAYGRTIHNALYTMEEHATGPEEALERVWDPRLPIDRLREAKNDLERYMARGGPMATFGTLAVELNLKAQLYVDDDFGPVFYGGFIDWTGLDVEQPHILHLVDYKAGWNVPKREDVLNNVQLRGYDWLIRENWERLGMSGFPHVVCHLDAIKWKDVEVKFTDEQIEDWREWASAIARRILRDEDGEPILNPGCGWCSVKMDCRRFRQLPGLGAGLAEKRNVQHLHQMVVWRDQAKETIKNLKAGVEEVDAAVEERVMLEGEFMAGRVRYYADTAWEDELDRLQLLDVLGARDYALLAGPTKRSLDAYLRDKDDETRAAVKACYERVPRGKKVKSEQVDG